MGHYREAGTVATLERPARLRHATLRSMHIADRRLVVDFDFDADAEVDARSCTARIDWNSGAIALGPGAARTSAVDDGTVTVVAVAQPDRPHEGPRLEVAGRTRAGAERWTAPVTSRAMLGAGASVTGLVAVLATDHTDEIDVCVHDNSPPARTVSLGRGQRFAAMAVRGRKILIVSQGEQSLLARTLASDLRSELNPVPLDAPAGIAPTAVRAAALPDAFAIAHHLVTADGPTCVASVFDGVHLVSVRLALASLDGFVVDGQDMVLASMVAGASAPVLVVQRVHVEEPPDRKHAPLLRPRLHAFVLGEPACTSSLERCALLADVADVVALSLGISHVVDVVLTHRDDQTDEMHFTAPGVDRTRDAHLAVRLRSDGSALASVRLGDGAAPELREAGLVTRIKRAFLGDDDGDPRTSSLEVPALATGVQSIVSLVWSLRIAT